MGRNIEFIPEEKIVKAMHVFWHKGYTSTSLTDLIAAMKINKSSMYNTFGDKHDLFKASLKAYGKLTEADYASALDPDKSALENIESIINQIATFSIERSNSCLGIKTSFELATEDNEIKTMIKSGHDQTITLIASLIQKAQKAGEINSTRDPNVMAHFIFNAFAGLRQSYIIYNDKRLIEKMTEELKRYVII